LTYKLDKDGIIVTEQKLAAQIYNKGKTGTPLDKGLLLLRKEEALYCDYRNDIDLTENEISKFKKDNLTHIVYKDLKERGLMVKVDKNGLRLYDRNIPTKGQSSAVIIAKNFKNKIDFKDIFNELDRGLERRIQIAIIDVEEDVVYYVTRIVEWPETKLKEDGNIIINDIEVKELIDKGYQINSGLKFGTHYRVYNYESKHAPWLIHIVKDGITWLDITRMVRVGHGVNKTIVLAYKKRWISLEWIKP
jgi:tRNA splicing endonuclease